MMFWPGWCCKEVEPGTFPVCSDLNGVPLYLSDVNGMHAMTHVSGDSYYVNYQFTPAASVHTDNLGNCVKNTDPVSVNYSLTCFRIGGTTYSELTIGFVVNSDPCGAPPTHPYRLYQRSDSHPVGNSWPAVTAGATRQVAYPLANPDALEFTFPATGTQPPFADYYDFPAPGLVTITL